MKTVVKNEKFVSTIEHDCKKIVMKVEKNGETQLDDKVGDILNERQGSPILKLSTLKNNMNGAFTLFGRTNSKIASSFVSDVGGAIEPALIAPNSQTTEEKFGVAKIDPGDGRGVRISKGLFEMQIHDSEYMRKKQGIVRF